MSNYRTMPVLLLLGGASGVLFLIASVLWARSFRVSDRLSTFTTSDPQDRPWMWRLWMIESRGGGVRLTVGHRVYRSVANIRYATEMISGRRFAWQVASNTQYPHFGCTPRTFLERRGFHYETRWTCARYLRGSHRIVVFPWWVPWTAAGVLPMFLGARARRGVARRRRVRDGLCVSCGYDLRASRDRCPECGRPVARAKPAGSCR